MELTKRALKAGINVGLCMTVAILLKVSYPFFLVLPSAVFLSSFGHSTIKAAGNRIVGTFIGAAVGVLLSFIAPENPIITGIGAVIIVYITNFLNFEAAATMGGIVFVSIMLGVKGQSPFNYSVNRLFYTIIGIVITVIVNILIFHEDFLNILKKGSSKSEDELLSALKVRLCSKDYVEIETIASKIRNLKAHLGSYSKYLNFGKNIKREVIVYRAVVDLLETACLHLMILCNIDCSCSINEANYSKAKCFVNCLSVQDNYKPTELNIVFNYHLSIVLESMEKLHSNIHL